MKKNGRKISIQQFFFHVKNCRCNATLHDKYIQLIKQFFKTNKKYKNV